MLISVSALTGLFVLMHFKFGEIPPLGKFLDPFSGFWQNGESFNKIPGELDLSGLQDGVIVKWDDRRVPHIFARNNHDLYFAQGYLMARDRLWQMEILTHSAAGRVSEIVGVSGIDTDRYQRRIGMVFAAENFLKKVKRNPEIFELVQAFSNGVNSFINSLPEHKLPVEYKLLDYNPEKWTPLKSALMLKLMSRDLTLMNNELQLTNALGVFDEQVLDKLYPLYPPFLEPIIPKGTKWDIRAEIPAKPINAPNFSLNPAEETDYGYPGIGSNNWAVSGEKTANGNPILCSDPHLGLSLPSIWYEVQLISPDVNVYGVSLPGTPGVIFGFNENIAWGLTNAGSDVLDYYAITFREGDFKEYLYNGEWRKTEIRIEEIKVRNSTTISDTVYYTHHGPVVQRKNESLAFRRIPQDAAMRWTAHDGSNETMAFHLLNRAKNYDEYVSAISNFDNPAQNFVFADASGDIAIWHNGKFPLRWDKQGRFISDGSDPDFEWKGWVPREQVPHIRNPERGFVSSANQNPVDENYPYYLGWYYATFARLQRINERLEEMNGITPEDMIKLQYDSKNLYARTLLPSLLKRIDAPSLTETESKAFKKLSEWNFDNLSELAAPMIYDLWWRELNKSIWIDDMVSPQGQLRGPGRDVTIDMILNEPGNPFIDNKITPEKETLDDISMSSFKTACGKLTKLYGEDESGWKWANRGTDIHHLARIPQFGRLDLPTSGDAGIVNATSRTFGPSWRMVVQLGPDVKAWGLYPGGQSGNPGSPFYDNMVDDWVIGKTQELLYLGSSEDENSRITSTTVMGGKK